MPTIHSCQVMSPMALRTDEDGRDEPGDRHRDGEAGDAGHVVADVLGEQDVRRPAARRRRAQSTPTGSAVPCHGSVSSTTPTAASSGQANRPGVDPRRPRHRADRGTPARSPCRAAAVRPPP